jgi:hypothetical protein
MQSVISLFHITHFYVHDSKIKIMDHHGSNGLKPDKNADAL